MKKRMIITLVLLLVMSLPICSFAATTKSVTKTNTFSGNHIDYGLQAWATKTILKGTFSKYVDEKVVEKIDILQSVMLHSAPVGNGNMTSTIFTYKGTTPIGTYYVPTGFTAYSIIYDPTTTYVYWHHDKSINDSGLRTLTMKVKTNYFFFVQDVYPLNSWNSSTYVTY